MKQMLVTKSIAYAAKAGGGTIAGINELNLLDTGAIAVFTADNVMLTAANVAASSPDVKSFYIAVGNQAAGGKTYISQLIPRMLLDYRKKAYVAPVKNVKFIGADGTSGAFNMGTLVAGTEAFIRITDTTPGLRTVGGGVYDGEIKRYSTVVRTGDTETLIANRLIAAINADPDSIVVAAAVAATTGINLTAKNFGTTFSISLDGILINATKYEVEGSNPNATAVAMKIGDGTSDQILAQELVYSTERGNTNQVSLPQYYYAVPTNVVSGTTYDTYTFAWTGQRKIANETQNTYAFETVLAMPAAATQQANFETIMLDLVGNFENSEAGA